MITTQNAAQAVRAATDYFDAWETLDVRELGSAPGDAEGYVNYVYRISDSRGGSLVLKQARSLPKHPDIDPGPFVQERNAHEAAAMRVIGAVCPGLMPKLYAVNRAEHYYICEDFSALRPLRRALIDGDITPETGWQIGERLARLSFYTSEIYLDACTHRALMTRFLNSTMRQLFETVLFLPADTGPGAAIGAEADVQTQLLRLRERHMLAPLSLVHGDLHTSNIFVDADGAPHFIDCEYATMGPPACDAGYLAGNLIYALVRWRNDPERRAQMYKFIGNLLSAYRDTYTTLWEEDARPHYKGQSGYRAARLRDFYAECAGATGAQILSRIGSGFGCPDIDAIDNTDRARDKAIAICLALARDLILNWEQVTSPELFMCRLRRQLARAERLV